LFSTRSVDFGSSFDRIPHPDAALESSIKEVLLTSDTLNMNVEIAQNSKYYRAKYRTYGTIRASNNSD
jgi:hypothetical protein